MLEYAFKKNQEDNLIYISEVENGLGCDCVCPSCKKILIAKQGKKKIHHFAHYEVADCGYGLQTALHIKAKEILEKYKTFKIPLLMTEHKGITKKVAEERII
jgi:competence CoiA-like predicted nuclease